MWHVPPVAHVTHAAHAAHVTHAAGLPRTVGPPARPRWGGSAPRRTAPRGAPRGSLASWPPAHSGSNRHRRGSSQRARGSRQLATERAAHTCRVCPFPAYVPYNVQMIQAVVSVLIVAPVQRARLLTGPWGPRHLRRGCSAHSQSQTSAGARQTPVRSAAGIILQQHYWHLCPILKLSS
jgi:hypothetical protein